MKGAGVGALSRAGATRLYRRLRPASMPVLFLHGVLPEDEARPFNSSGKFVSPDRLAGYLRRISSMFRVVPLEEIVEHGIRGAGLRNSMAITFDDGYANTYHHALPVLEDLGMPFTVFVTTGFTGTGHVAWNDRLEFAVQTARAGRLQAGLLPEDLPLTTPRERGAAVARLKERLKTMPIDETETRVREVCRSLGAEADHPALRHVRYLDPAQIREMAGRGVAFGAHTVTHPILSREKPERVRAEISGSKEALEGWSGVEVRHFAYPNGRRQDYNELVIEELKRAGFRSAATSIHGLARAGDDPYQMKRIVFDNRWPYEVFETRVSGLLGALGRGRAEAS